MATTSNSPGSIVTRVYSGFRGVDFRGDEISLSRSPDALNVWKDYKETDSIRTRPGLKLFAELPSPIYGLFFFQGAAIIHSGTKLYRMRNETLTTIYTGMNPQKSNGFVFDGVFYIKDGKNYLRYDGKEAAPVVGFVPTTSIGRKPSGGGQVYQDVNYLSPYRINTFCANGVSLDYALDARDIDPDDSLEVTIDGESVTDFTVDCEKGVVSFRKAPPAPKTDGQDNVSIQYRKTVKGYADRILKCTLLQEFDNRVFFSGNPDYPNMIFHCSLNDPTYCSDLDYYNEGQDKAAVKGMVAGNNALWVFREPSDSNTTVFYHTPTIDADYGKIYPSTHSNVSTGCIGRAVNFGDDICFFSSRGMEGISGDITTEQVLGHRSSLIDRKLTAEGTYRDMVLAEWEGYLLVFIGGHVYLADSRAAFSNNSVKEYDWYYWEIGKNVTCANVQDGTLYIGTEDGGVYTFDNEVGGCESYWTTPKDKFKSPNREKTTNKRGCIVEATGDMEVFAKIEDTEFESVGAYTGITDYIACRIKRKKFKDLQLKFASNTKMSLECVTMEAFLGGYIKR